MDEVEKISNILNKRTRVVSNIGTGVRNMVYEFIFWRTRWESYTVGRSESSRLEDFEMWFYTIKVNINWSYKVRKVRLLEHRLDKKSLELVSNKTNRGIVVHLETISVLSTHWWKIQWRASIVGEKLRMSDVGNSVV